MCVRPVGTRIGSHGIRVGRTSDVSKTYITQAGRSPCETHDTRNRTTPGTTLETTQHTQDMIGADGVQTPDRHGPDTVSEDTGFVVDWHVRTRRRLRTVGLARPVSVAVVVVDRRGCETTPSGPGLLSVDGHRVLVVPDRRDGAPPVEVWVAGGPSQYGDVVRTLRWTVALDASIDAAFEAASQPRRVHPGDDVPTYRGSATRPTESMLLAFDDANTSLAIGGFAGAVELLE